MEQGEGCWVPYEVLGDCSGVVWMGQALYLEQGGAVGNTVGQRYRGVLPLCAVRAGRLLGGLDWDCQGMERTAELHQVRT